MEPLRKRKLGWSDRVGKGGVRVEAGGGFISFAIYLILRFSLFHLDGF